MDLGLLSMSEHSICTLLVQRRTRWADVVQISYKCFVFSGIVGDYVKQRVQINMTNVVLRCQNWDVLLLLLCPILVIIRLGAEDLRWRSVLTFLRELKALCIISIWRDLMRWAPGPSWDHLIPRGAYRNMQVLSPAGWCEITYCRLCPYR